MFEIKLFMPKKSLSSYIQEQLNRGFSPETIKRHLMKYGHKKDIISQAFNELKPEIRHTIHLSKTALIAIIILALGLIIVGSSFYLINQQAKAPKQLLDLKLNIINNELRQGDKLDFNVELSSLGAIKRYDVTLNYLVTDSNNKIVTSKTETVALETRASITTEINIPKNTPIGNYILKINAKYNNKVASASDTFRISSITKDTCFNNIKDYDEEDIDCGGPCKPCPTCFDGIKNQNEEGIDCGGPCKECKKDCNDNNKCTRDYFKNGRCFNDPIEPCCGNLICEAKESETSCPEDCEEITMDFPGLSSSEIIEIIKQISLTEPEKASKLCDNLEQQTFIDQCFSEIAETTRLAKFCKKITNERTKDNCYKKLAEIIENSLICDEISIDSRRDACYINFVNIGDYSVCDKITNDYLRKSCEALKQIG